MDALICRAWYNSWTIVVIEKSCRGLSTVFSHEPALNFEEILLHLEVDQ